MRVPGALRQTAGGEAVVAFDLDDGATVDQLLDAVADRHPALERRVRDEQGTLRPHVNLFVGDEDVRQLEGAGTVLRPGDEVSVVPAISGG